MKYGTKNTKESNKDYKSYGTIDLSFKLKLIGTFLLYRLVQIIFPPFYRLVQIIFPPFLQCSDTNPAKLIHVWLVHVD